VPPRKTTRKTTLARTSPRTTKPAQATPAGTGGGKHKLIGLLWIFVGAVLFAYLAFGLYVYLQAPSDNFTTSATVFFNYPAQTITVPGYALYFIGSLVSLVVLVLSFLWAISLLVARSRDNLKRLLIAGALVVVSAAGVTLLPPAGTATIGWHAYLARYHALTMFQDKQMAAAGQQAGAPQQNVPPTQLRAEALKQLTQNAVVRQEAIKRGVKVSQKEVDETYKQYAQRSQGEEALRKQLKDYLGWSPSQFKSEIRVKLLQDKLNMKLQTDDKLNADRKQKAEAALSEIRAGKDFGEVAKTNSDDPTAQAGGDQGFLKRGEVAPQIEGPAFSLDVGKVSDLIKTDQGYVILKVLEKQPDQVHLQEILVKTQSLSDYIPEQLKKTKVNVFVKDLVWNKTLYTIQPKDQQQPGAPGETPQPGAPGETQPGAPGETQPGAAPAADASAPPAAAPGAAPAQ